MALREFSAADKAAFTQFVEAALADGIYPRRDLNTAVTHCLIYIGLQKGDGWRAVLAEKNEKNAKEMAWFSRQQPPALSDGSLMALCMAMALAAKNIAIDESKQQITAFGRPLNSQRVDNYLQFRSRIGEEKVEKLSQECESMFLLAAMQPNISVLYSNGFKTQQPDLSWASINNTLLPMFEGVENNLASIYGDLASMLPHLTVNFSAAGLAEWAKSMTQDKSIASQAHLQRWSRDEYCAQIAALQKQQVELRSWIPTSIASTLPISELPGELSAVPKSQLRLLYDRAKEDVEMLCKHQPKAVDRMTTLRERLVDVQKARIDILPSIDVIEKADNPKVKAAARPIEEPNWVSLPLEEQVKRLSQYIENCEQTTKWLEQYMVK